MAAAPSLVESLRSRRPGYTEEEDLDWLQHLREARAEVRDLQVVLEKVRNGETTLKVYADYIRKTMDDIGQLMAKIQNGDSVRHLRNLWEQIAVNPALLDPEASFDAREQLQLLSMLDVQCKGFVFQAGVLTIPSRVNRWLDGARTGYYIPFHLVFDDELPAWEDRQRVLNYLAWSPRAIKGGLVDAESGLIYRYSQNRQARLGSFLLLAVAFLAAVGVIVGACYLPVEGWPVGPSDLPAFLVGWGAVLAGVVVHMGIESVKRTQAQGGRPPIIAVGDLPLLVNSRIGQILQKLLLTLVGFFGLVFAAGATNITPFSSFLVGYSLDSFVGLFGASIEQRAGAQLVTLKRQLGTVDGP
jgi:hypothetical protein